MSSSTDDPPVPPRRKRSPGTAVAPPPPLPAGYVRPTWAADYVRPEDRKGWRCRACARWSRKPYEMPSRPDERCVECEEALGPEEANTVVLHQHTQEMARTREAEEAAGAGAGRVTQPGSTPGKAALRPTDPTSPWCDINEAGTLLGCRRTKIFALIRKGKLQPVPDAPARQTQVLRSSVMAYRDELSRAPKKKVRGTRPPPTAASPKVPDPETLKKVLREQRRKLFP